MQFGLITCPKKRRTNPLYQKPSGAVSVVCNIIFVFTEQLTEGYCQSSERCYEADSIRLYDTSFVMTLTSESFVVHAAHSTQMSRDYFFSYQQSFQVQHMFFPEDDHGCCAAESVSAVSL